MVYNIIIILYFIRDLELDKSGTREVAWRFEENKLEFSVDFKLNALHDDVSYLDAVTQLLLYYLRYHFFCFLLCELELWATH